MNTFQLDGVRPYQYPMEDAPWLQTKTIDVRFKYSEDQPRVPAGSPEGGQFEALAGTTPERVAKDREWLTKAYGADVSQEVMVSKLESLLKQASPQETAEGLRWYQDAHDFAHGLSAQYGLPIEQVNAIIAATSPNTRWSFDGDDPLSTQGMSGVTNKAVAERAIMMATGRWDSDTLTVDKPLLDKWFESNVTRISGQGGTAESKAMGVALLQEKYDNHLANSMRTYQVSTMDPDLLAELHPSVRALHDNFAKATELARGVGAPNEVLSGAKVRSFYSNISDPESSQDVTIDTHMVNGLINRAAGPVVGKSFTNRPGAYVVLSEPVRTVAAAHGLMPHQVQAITWIVQQNIDKAEGKRK